MNFPIKEFNADCISSYFVSPSNIDEIQIDTKVSAIIFITPVIRFEIDTKDEMCQL